MRFRGDLKRGALVLGLLLPIALVVLTILTRRPLPAAAAPIQARLELAAGEVTLTSGEHAARAISGTPLVGNAAIATSRGARALVRLPNGASVFLRDETNVALALGVLSLDAGEFWLEAPATDREPLAYQAGAVSISAAQAGLSVRRTGTTVTVYVARGMAVVTAPGGRVEVNAGEQAKVDEGQAPKITPVAFWDDWTGGMADFESGQHTPGAGMGTIYGLDPSAPAGAAAGTLEISKQVVRATVREGLSETEVDQTFFNPGEHAVEGWYWFTVPERASVTGFAVETNGELVAGEFQERREAATNYAEAKASGAAPAILEWIDSHTYRARIYPIHPGSTRRVVLRYLELRPVVDGKLEYLYPMGSRRPVRIGEFSLTVDLGKEGEGMKIATLADARVEEGGRKVTMRRSGYSPRADFQLQAELPDGRHAFTVARHRAEGESADYVMARYTPDVNWHEIAPQNGAVVVVVDTSAAGDEGARQLKTATAEAILRALSEQDQFALVSLDSKPVVLHPQGGLAPASDKEIDQALARLAGHASGGATDLSALFDVSLRRLHGAEQPAVIYVGDGIATSGDLTGEQLIERLRRALANSRARLFTVAVGTDADHALLSELARAGGGEGFRVDQSEETTARALQLAAALKIPTITDLSIELGAGLDEPFLTANGKLSRGSDVVLLARTHHEIPRQVSVKGRVGGKPFEKQYEVFADATVLSAFVPRLWAAEYVRRLLGSSRGPEAERGRIVALGLEYGLLSPYTSILALESEAAYRQRGIQRNQSKLRGVKLGSLDEGEEWRLAEYHAATSIPGLVWGCSRDKIEAASLAEQAPPLAVADNKESGEGTRAKGEERSMSVAPPPPAAEGTLVATAAEEADTVGASALSPQANQAAGPARPAADEELAPLGPGSFGGGKGGGPFRSSIGTADPPKAKKASLALPRPPTSPRGEEPAAPNKPAVGTCSDTAGRPLAHRVLMWKRRLKTATNVGDLLARYDAAGRACELPDWRAQRTFLDLLQQHVSGEGEVQVALDHFRAQSEVQKHLAKLILRRTVDDRVIAAVNRSLFGQAVDWTALDLELTEMPSVEDRIVKLREEMAKAGEDPRGEVRLVRLLMEAGRKDEALTLGRRLRDQGIMTPLLAQQLGDVLARAGLVEEAIRTYSELVEFDPRNLASRRLLGDIYLGHGWYGPAYRQYLTLTEAAPDDAFGVLRLAAAAAGAGRIDEALRLERKVASAQGNPGPSDPRRWARTLSAARLGRLMTGSPPAPGEDRKRRQASLQREIKELQLWSGPGTLVILTWEDLGADLALVTRIGEEDLVLGDTVDAAGVGLSSTLLATPEAARAAFVARLRNEPRSRPVKLTRTDLEWDGKECRVRVKAAELAPKATWVLL